MTLFLASFTTAKKSMKRSALHCLQTQLLKRRQMKVTLDQMIRNMVVQYGENGMFSKRSNTKRFEQT